MVCAYKIRIDSFSADIVRWLIGGREKKKQKEEKQKHRIEERIVRLYSSKRQNINKQ